MPPDPQLGFSPIRTKRVLESVVVTLEEPILNGTLKDGDMLPSEEQLATQLGVGRRAVREALKVLETKGLVEVQMGVGTVVRRNDLDSFLETLSHNVRSYLYVNKAQAKHVMDLRLLLEGAALEQLTRQPDPERFQRLRDDIARQERALNAGDFQAYQEWHFHFHNEIVDTLDNPVISMLYRQVMALVRAPMERAGALPERTVNTIRQHGQLVDEAERGSVAEVRAVLSRHLQNFFLNVQDHDDGFGAELPRLQAAADGQASAASTDSSAG
jgi:GntR family transcriptional repressor for pyruvate dehydrogenase complex